MSLYLLQSVCYLNSFVATLSFHSLLPSFRFNSSLPFGRSFGCNWFLSFVSSFLSFQLSPFIRYCLPFVSTLPFHSILPSIVSTLSFHSLLLSVRFNSDIPLVATSLRFKSFISLRPSFRFTSYMPIVSVHYFFPFVSPLAVRLSLGLSLVAALSFHSLLPSFRCNSSLPFGCSFRLNSFLISFSIVVGSGLAFAIQAATYRFPAPCGHLLQLRPLAATCGHLLPQPPAATCGHSSGCRWLPCTCSRDPLQPAATCSHLRPLAATCGHLRPLAPTAPCGHLRPLVATCGHSSGCKWLRF